MLASDCPKRERVFSQLVRRVFSRRRRTVNWKGAFMELAAELQRIYDSEINVRISWLWDGGIEVRLGDEMNGFLAEETVPCVADIVPWLQEVIAHFFPASSYAASLSAEIRERTATRLFRPPSTGASVICPHCGAPHAAPPGMEEIFMFFCAHCGTASRWHRRRCNRSSLR
jgi:hypothetical protein